MAGPSPQSLEAAIVFGGTLSLLLARPARVPDWAAALVGALLMLVLGLLSPSGALRALASASNVLLFFAGLGLASAAADRSGVFHAAARVATVFANGSQQRLLIGIFLAGVAVTAVLSNDATALLLTPVAYAAATRLGLNARPYAFTCALVANAASFVLPVSNPSNLLVLSAVPLTLGAFVIRLLIPSILGLGVTLAGLLWVFRDELAAPFDERFAVTSQTGSLPRRTRVGLVGVAGLGLAYLVAGTLGWPLGWVAVVGALILVAADSAVSGWHAHQLLAEAPWSLLALVVGLLVLIAGAEQVGLFASLGAGLLALASLGPAGVPLTVASLAVLANVINNLPAALVASSALRQLAAGPAQADLAAAAIVGVNLGPNLTTIGSLATMLWLVLLRRRGLHVSVVEYLRVGAVVTVPALLVAAASLWALAALLGQ